MQALRDHARVNRYHCHRLLLLCLWDGGRAHNEIQTPSTRCPCQCDDGSLIGPPTVVSGSPTISLPLFSTEGETLIVPSSFSVTTCIGSRTPCTPFGRQTNQRQPCPVTSQRP